MTMTTTKSDDDDADDDNDEEVDSRTGKRDRESAIGTTDNGAKPFFDLSKKYTSSSPSDAVFAIVVDNEGNVYASYPGGVVVIDSSGTEIASLVLSSANTGRSKNDDDKPTSTAELPSDDSLIVPTALAISQSGTGPFATRTGPAALRFNR